MNIGTVKVSINGTTDGTKSATKQHKHSNTTNNNNNHLTKDNKHPTTSLIAKMAKQNKNIESGKPNNATSKETLPNRTAENNSTLTSRNKTLIKVNETGNPVDEDNFAKLEKEKDKLSASLANLKQLDISPHQPPSNPTPPIRFNNTVMADTEDTQEVTHDFTPIKDMADRAKTITEVFKQNGSVLLAADGSSKHLFIPNYHDALKFNNNSNDKENNKDQTQLLNETLASSTTKSSNFSTTSSVADLQNSTVLHNVTTTSAKNSTTTDIQEGIKLNQQKTNNSTTGLQEDSNRQHAEGQDKLMTYMKGMSKSSADIKNIKKTNTTTTDMERYGNDEYETSNHLDKAEEVVNPTIITGINTNKTTHSKDEEPTIALPSLNSINNNNNKNASFLAINATATELEASGVPIKHSPDSTSNTKNTTATTNDNTVTLKEDPKQKNMTESTGKSSTTSKKHEDVDLEEQNRMENNRHTNNTFSTKEDEEEEEEEEVRQIKMLSNANDDDKGKLGMTKTVTNKTVESEDELRQGTADHQQQSGEHHQKPILSNITNSQEPPSMIQRGNMTNEMTASSSSSSSSSSSGNITAAHELIGDDQGNVNNNMKNMTHHHKHHHHHHGNNNNKTNNNNESMGKMDNSDSSSILNRTLDDKKDKKETSDKKTESPSLPSSNSVQVKADAPKEINFQMQNTTYKVFDSNPSAETSSTSQPSTSSTTTATESRPDVSKVEKASYDKALGIDTKIMNNNNNKKQQNDNKLPKKAPTKVEQQSYRPPVLRHFGGEHQQHQHTKRKLLMNVTLAEAMEKMNPTSPSEQVYRLFHRLQVLTHMYRLVNV